MLSRLLFLALLLLPGPALAGVKEVQKKVAALAPSALVLVMDANGNELVAQNVDAPFVPASVTKVDVWCRRFDYVFTDAELAPPT